MKLLITEFVKGLFLGILYLQTTQANDTTFENIASFAFFYILMVLGGLLTGIDRSAVTNAFLTKTIFTLVDERIKRDETK